VTAFREPTIRDAFEANASDVHLEATRSGLISRYRLDGVLTPATSPPPELQHAVISRIKLLAELDIAERRRPQDGRVRVRLEDRELDLRVSTIPTTHGESVVLRLLDRAGSAVALEELGLEPGRLSRFCELVARPHGLVLVTGPTGSGKTTTLYAAVSRRDVNAEKIITVEDPVEYQLPGITQMPVHRPAGVTFASALRAILRQDPDVVMIGEMRDHETAEIAVQAAMTGHLVLSTLHTNDAIGAIPRLRDLGIPDYLVAATLDGVLAQRLVRRICSQCRTSCEVSPERVAQITRLPSKRTMLYRGVGCPACRGTGFKGRTGIFELLVIDDSLRDAMTRGAPRNEVRTLVERQRMCSLREDGWSKCALGLTTVDEVLRVIQD
jgi:general secretion pathway protein E